MSRAGYIILNFFELSRDDFRVEGAGKKTFIVTLKNMDVLLDLNTSAPYIENDQND